MKKIKVYFACVKPSDEILAPLMNDKFELSFQTDYATTDTEMMATAGNPDAVLFAARHYWSADLLKAMPNLKLMAFCGTGYQDFIDAAAANELGIAIANTPGANADSVAELAIGLALDAVRKITFTHGTNIRPWTRQLSELQIGMIGHGAVNRRIYQILTTGFGANVRYWNRTKTDASVDLDIILQESDMIFMGITGGDTTRNYIGASEFAKMKDGVIIVNPARKTLIDIDAAMHALESGKLGTLAMDGTLDADCPFRKFGPDRFIQTPHLGALTHAANDNIKIAAIQNVVEFFNGGAGRNIVNPEHRQNIKK